MKLKAFLPIVLLLLSFNFYAQSEKTNEKRAQIKAMKVAFFTSELNLTPNEAEKFWPLFNIFDDKQFELRYQKMKSLKKRINNESLDKMTEKEANTLLSQINSTDEELFLLRKRFFSNLRGIIPAIKILKLRKAEDDFSRNLLQQYRDKAKKQ